MQQVKIGAGKSCDEVTQGPVLTEGPSVRDSSVTGRGGDARSAYGSDCAWETVLYTGPGLHRPEAGDLQEAAGSVRVLAGYLMSDIAAPDLVRVLPMLPRQPGGPLAAMLAYQMAQATAALTKYCRRIGATGSTLSTGSSAWQ